MSYSFIVTVTINDESQTFIVEEHQPLIISEDHPEILQGVEKIKLVVRHNGDPKNVSG